MKLKKSLAKYFYLKIITWLFGQIFNIQCRKTFVALGSGEKKGHVKICNSEMHILIDTSMHTQRTLRYLLSN